MTGTVTLRLVRVAPDRDQAFLRFYVLNSHAPSGSIRVLARHRR